MAKTIETDPDACPETWMSQPGQRQHNGCPCECLRGKYHVSGCECGCGSTPPPGKRDLVDLVKRIAITEIRPGDVLVFETDNDIDDREFDGLQRLIREVLGDDTLSIVIRGGRLGGVLRHEHAARPDRHAEGACGFLWRDEHNPTGSDHKCGGPIHTGVSGEHQCACGGTRPVTLRDVPPGMVETTSFSDLAKGRRTYLPGNQEPLRHLAHDKVLDAYGLRDTHEFVEESP